MSIHIILGKPGGGKSLYATRLLVRDIVETERNIVTNLPLLPGRLNEYLQEQYPGKDFRLVQRLRIMTEEEMHSFWRFRGPGEKVADEISQELPEYNFAIAEGEDPEKAMERQAQEYVKWQAICTRRLAMIKSQIWALGDLDGRKGVSYFLDEAHIAFNARDWAKLGRDCLHYMSQHRKLGDVVYPITQHVGNLDKQFRSVAEDYTMLRNEYVAQFGIFRGRGRFVAKTSLTEPGPNVTPFKVTAFQLDPEGVASCYDTAQGIGVHGSQADKGRRAKGISILWVIPAFLCLALSVVAIPYGIGKLAGGALTGKSAKEAHELSGKLAGKPASAQFTGPMLSSGPTAASLEATAAAYVWVREFMQFRGVYRIELSDGRRYRSDVHSELEEITRDYVVVSGQRYPFLTSF